MLARVARIMAQLNQSWDVLSTLTPAEYSSFRGSLGSSSGFQSFQYRMVEFLLGNKNAVHDGAAPPPRRPLRARSRRCTARPRSTTRRSGCWRAAGFADRSGVCRARLRTPCTRSTNRCCAAWVEVYRDTGRHWELYELAEKLVDLEDAFRQWRFRHATTVERIIGLKRGTGGTSGVGYLRRVLEVVLFPELWRARTEI